MRVVVTALALLSATAFAAEKQKVVVLDLAVYDASNADAAKTAALEKLGKITTEQVASVLTEKGFDVLGSSDIAAILGAERQKELAGCGEGSSQCLAEMSGALGAPYIVTGTLSRAGKELKLDLKLIETASSKVLSRQGESLPDEGAVFAAVKQMVPRLLFDAKLVTSASSGGKTPIAPLVVTGVGAAAAITGGVLLGLQASATSALQTDISSHAVAIDEATTRRQDIMGQRSAGVALAAGGGVVAAAGLIWYFVAKPSDTGGVALLPTASGAMVTWGTTW